MITIEENISFKKLSTLKTGGAARFLAHIKNSEELSEALSFAEEKDIPVFVIGGGSNILPPDEGFSGLVIKMENKGIQYKYEEEVAYVSVEAGEIWDDFVEKSVIENLWGLENLSAIPGTVGASAVQNIGAYGREVKDVIFSVDVFDSVDKKIKTLTNSECLFSYRDSIFKKEEGKKFIVTKVIYKLSRIPWPELSYKDLKNFFGEKMPTLREIRDAVTAIRAKKFPDLKVCGTAGSFFKNILLTTEEFSAFSVKYPDAVSFDAENGMKKISSAWILDKVLQMKGVREGDVGLFENQPLVLVNFGNASATDVKNFAEKIKNKVKEKTNLSIEEEVVVIENNFKK